MEFPSSKNAKAPLLNWDVFSTRYNALLGEAIKYHETVLAIKNIAKANKWSKQQLKESIENASKYIIVITDSLQNISFTCHNFEGMTGYNFEEAKGRNPKFLQGPGTNRGNKSLIKKRLANNETAEVILENYRKDGEPYLCNVIIKPIISINKKLVNYIAYEQEIAA